MLINFSNHPYALWSEAQKNAAAVYGECVDFPFPAVDPALDEAAICAKADALLPRLLAMHPAAVLCQGEMTFGYAMVHRLMAAGVPVLAACSSREAVEQPQPDGTMCKVSVFRFVQFRRYTV